MAASSCPHAGGAGMEPDRILFRRRVGGVGCCAGGGRLGPGWAITVQANRSMTVEVTAQDEQGFASGQKAMPLIGVWKASDALGSLPSVAAADGGVQCEFSGDDFADGE